MTLAEACAKITPPDARIAAAVERRLDGKTKPRGSLGRLEAIASRVAAARRDPAVRHLDKAIVVLGADHGVAAEGVSAYPQEVTRQMLLNFAAGGAAINVLARHAGARLVVADLGVREPLPDGCGVRALRIGAGTQSFLSAPAMSRADALRAVETGIALARELAADGVGIVGLGEMGIGNTTSASALTAVFTGAPADELVGRGTGIDDAGLRRKIAVVRDALALHRPRAEDPVDALAKVGGFEIAALAGVVLGAAAERMVVMLDGFITGAAALAALALAPDAAGYLLASHRSVEMGHRRALEKLGAEPLLDLGLRLGEGTGAALAMPLVDAALKILDEMATFESAGVSDSGA